MVKFLRPYLPGRFLPRVKTAEQFTGYIVHGLIHSLHIIGKQRLQKCIADSPTSSEPSLGHPLKHHLDFYIGQLQVIFRFPDFGIKILMLHFQIPAGKPQAPRCLTLAGLLSGGVQAAEQ